MLHLFALAAGSQHAKHPWPIHQNGRTICPMTSARRCDTCAALLDAVSAVKGAQGTLDESAALLRKAAESHADAAAAV
jgi:hypothetical protein